MTVRELILQCKNQLVSDEAEREARLIVAATLGKNATDLRLSYSNQVEQGAELQCEEIVKKRNCGEPLQYILGECEFFGLPFYVGKGVLIPRQDTELLVETALELIKNKPSARVLDLCSGSGCVAVSVAKQRADVKVDAVELYDEAYAFLLNNIKRNCADNVTPIKADALNFVGDYDLVVCNPPYIAQSERDMLSKEVMFEPHSALFAEDNGLLFYNIIANNFEKKCDMAFEIGYTQGEAVEKILLKHGAEVRIIKDLCQNDRVVVAKF